MDTFPERELGAEVVADEAEEGGTGQSGDKHHREAVLHGRVCIVIDVLHNGIVPDIIFNILLDNLDNMSRLTSNSGC